MIHCGIFVTVKDLKQPKYPLIEDWTNKFWSFYTMENYTARKRKERERRRGVGKKKAEDNLFLSWNTNINYTKDWNCFTKEFST